LTCSNYSAQDDRYDLQTLVSLAPRSCSSEFLRWLHDFHTKERSTTQSSKPMQRTILTRVYHRVPTTMATTAVHAIVGASASQPTFLGLSAGATGMNGTKADMSRKWLV
ncbi:hypothetical protein LTR16_007732, partial [Cryomyces antarcticus]